MTTDSPAAVDAVRALSRGALPPLAALAAAGAILLAVHPGFMSYDSLRALDQRPTRLTRCVAYVWVASATPLTRPWLRYLLGAGALVVALVRPDATGPPQAQPRAAPSTSLRSTSSRPPPTSATTTGRSSARRSSSPSRSRPAA